jgi:hypothetical protein
VKYNAKIIPKFKSFALSSLLYTGSYELLKSKRKRDFALACHHGMMSGVNRHHAMGRLSKSFEVVLFSFT